MLFSCACASVYNQEFDDMLFIVFQLNTLNRNISMQAVIAHNSQRNAADVHRQNFLLYMSRAKLMLPNCSTTLKCILNRL